MEFDPQLVILILHVLQLHFFIVKLSVQTIDLIITMPNVCLLPIHLKEVILIGKDLLTIVVKIVLTLRENIRVFAYGVSQLIPLILFTCNVIL